MKLFDTAAVNEYAVTADDAGHVDGHKAIAADDRCHAVDQQDERNSRDRIKTIVPQPQPVEDSRECAPGGIAERHPEAHLQEEHRHQVDRLHRRIGHQADHAQCQEDRHRVVAARLQLQQRLELALEADALAP